MANDIAWPKSFVRLPNGFDQKIRSRRIFLHSVFEKNGIGALLDLKMAFRFSREKLIEQDLIHLVEAYDDSTSFRFRTGNFLHYSEEGWRPEFNDEINQIVTSDHYEFVESDYENQEAPGYRRRRIRPKRTASRHFKEFENVENSNEKVKLMATKVGSTMPLVFLDMRWLVLSLPVHLNALQENLFLDLFAYCLSFRHRTGRRLFPGLEAALICDRWKTRHSYEMISYSGELARELMINRPISISKPLEQKYSYRGLECNELENLLFSDRVEEFLRGLDRATLMQMREKCEYTKLSFLELGPHALLELYRNFSNLRTRGSIETTPNWTREINCYVNKKTLIAANNALAPFVLPTLSIGFCLDFVKYLAWTNFQVLLVMRYDLKDHVDLLIDLSVNVLQSSYLKCSAQMREQMPTIDEIVQNEEWKSSFEMEMQMYKSYVSEVRWMTMEEVRRTICTVAGRKLEIGKEGFLSYLAYNHIECLVRMRLMLASSPKPLMEHNESELWGAFYQCKVSEPQVTARFDLEHVKQLQGWTNDFSREIASFNPSNAPSAYLKDTYRKILLHTGVTSFLGVLNKCHVYPMIVLAHEMYHEKLEKLGAATIWHLFTEVIQHNFQLPDYGTKALKDQWVLESSGYKRLDAAEYLHHFRVLPDIFKFRPELEKYNVPSRNADESVSDYINNKGVAAFLRIVDFEKLRALRLIALSHGFENRLDELDEDMMIATWEEASVSTDRLTDIDQDLWECKYSFELKEYYYSGQFAPKKAWLFDDQIIALIRPLAYCESDLRAVVRNPNAKMSRRSIWKDHRDLFPEAMKTLEEIPEDWWSQCEQWQNEELKDNRLTESLFFEDDSVPINLDVQKTVWVTRWPTINPEYLVLMLIYSPLSLEDVCLKFLGLHYKFPIFINSPTIIHEIENMPCKRLAVIYKLLMGNPDCTDHRGAVRETAATPTAKRRHVGKLATCSWCYHRSSHYTNICVLKYTKEMRLEEAALNGTCLVCGLWNRTDCPVQDEHPVGRAGKFTEAELNCHRCAKEGLPSRHTNNMCLKESRFVNEYGTVLRQVRTVVKATMGLKEEELVEVYRKVVQFFKENTKAPNAYRYTGENWSPDHFDVKNPLTDRRFKLGHKRNEMVKPTKSSHSPPPPRIYRTSLPRPRY